MIFVEGGKPENPEKTLGAGTRTNNKLPGLEMEPGTHWWEASALTTAPSPLPNNIANYSDLHVYNTMYRLYNNKSISIHVHVGPIH